MKMPRKVSRNCFQCHACKQKNVYINDKVGCDSRDNTEEVIKEDNGVEMSENAERENNNEKESESDKETKNQ